MHRFTTFSTIAIFASLPFLGMGCVPQDKYDQLLMARRTDQEALKRAEDEREAALAKKATAMADYNRVNQAFGTLESQYNELNDLVTGLEDENRKYLGRISSLEIGPLPADVESALHLIAAEFPEVLSFDSRRGMLRFSSDFTFALGSAALREEARKTVTRLAGILKSDSAKGFEVRIIGHTDSVPIRRADTKRNHPTNVHLSVHRAISVRDALTTAGLDPVRIQVAGYGPYRPLVPNRKGGVAENRRVEVYLVPMPALDVIDIPTKTSTPNQPASDASTPEPMK